MNILNTNYNTVVVGTEKNDSIRNISNKVTIKSYGGNDTISNWDKYVIIDGGTGNDFIENRNSKAIPDGGSNTSINSGDGNDIIFNDKKSNNVTIDAGLGNDSIENTGYNVTINTGTGNDTIDNSGSQVTIEGGKDNDYIRNNGSSVSIEAGDGNDSITNNGSNSTIVGGTGNDSITNNGSNSTIVGGTGNDSITNNGSNSTIVGGKDNDSISNSGDKVVFLYNEGDGNDLIRGFNETSTLQIDNGSGLYSLSTSGSDILVTVGNGEQITLSGAANLSNVNIDGTPLTIINVDRNLDNKQNRIVVAGNDSDNTISNSGANVTIRANGGNDKISNSGESVSIDAGLGNDSIKNDSLGAQVTIAGGDGDDTIENNSGYVTVDAGTGDDSISNTASNVTINALAGKDTISNTASNIKIDGGDDNDIITNSGSYVTVKTGKGDNTIQNSGSRVWFEYDEPENFRYSVHDVIYGFNETSTLFISDKRDSGRGFNKKKNGNDVIVSGSSFTVTLVGAAAFPKVHVINQIPLNVNNSDSEKVIRGTTADDTIVNTGERVWISADAGDDSIDNNGSNSTIVGGSGNDTISNNGKYATINAGDDDDTIRNSEADFSLVDGYRGNDSIYSYSNNGTIFGGDGNDTIESYFKSKLFTLDGGDGNDFIKNTGNKAELYGGAGDDTIYSENTSNYIYSGNGNDLITIKGAYRNSLFGGGGNDTIELDNGSNEVLIRYKSGDGFDVIKGFNATSTLQIGNGNATYSKETVGNDIIITPNGKGKITLEGAATLSRVNIHGVTTLNAHNDKNDIQLNGDRLDDKVINSGSKVLINTFAGKDTVSNQGNYVIIDAGADDDTISSKDSNFVSVGGGLGNDTISIEGGLRNRVDGGKGNDLISATNSASVSVGGGEGNDSITNNGSNSSIGGGEGNDTISNSGESVSISGGAGNDSISNSGASVTADAGEGDDSITNSGSNVTITGGLGNDSISNSGDNVLFLHNSGDGNDLIRGFNETSTLQIGDGSGFYSLSTSGSDILVTVGNGEQITLSGAATLSTLNIIGHEKTPGKTIKNTTERASVVGTENDDSITNEKDYVRIDALGGHDTISNQFSLFTTILGGAGDDSIYNGNESNTVTILGGDGNDSISDYGFKTTIDGGAGDDQINLENSTAPHVIRYNAGDGNDIIYGLNDVPSYRNRNSISIVGGEYSSVQSGNDLILTVGDNSITLKGAANPSFSIYGVAERPGKNISNSKNNTLIAGTEHKDTITNSGSDVTINAGAGRDSITNSGDNVFFQYNAGDGKDTITGFNVTSSISIGGGEYDSVQSDDDLILTVGNDSIMLTGAATLDSVNILGERKVNALVIENTQDDTLITGTDSNETIKNTGLYVTISAGGGDNYIDNNGSDASISGDAGKDSIFNTASNVTIDGGADNDSIVNDFALFNSLSGGDGNDAISIVSSANVTVNGGAGNDSISLDGADEILIEYNAGDGNDIIRGFNGTSTLSIAGGSYSSEQSGDDVIITVGEDKITLQGAANFANLTIETKRNGNVITATEDNQKVSWDFGEATLSNGSVLEYKTEEGKNIATLTSKNYNDKITLNEGTTFNYGELKAELNNQSAISTKGANRISFYNNASANVTAPESYQIDIGTGKINVNNLPINSVNGEGTVTVEKDGLKFEGYGVQFVDLEVANENYFKNFTPMVVAYKSSDKSYTIQNAAYVKTLSNDFTKFTLSTDSTNAGFNINGKEFIVTSAKDYINVVEANGSKFKIQGKEIDLEKISRVNIDDKITFRGTAINFDDVQVNYGQGKTVGYSLDGEEVTISDAATLTTGADTKTITCAAGSYVINGKSFETSAALTITADTSAIKIPMSDAKTEIYFDGVKVSGISGGGELVFDLANNKTSIPDGAIINVSSPEAVKLNVAAGNFTIDNKKISSTTELEITADKDSIKVPLSENAVTVNGAAITGNGEMTIDNTNETFFPILLPDGALVANDSANLFALSGKNSAASFGDANKKVQMTGDGVAYVQFEKANSISVGFNGLIFEDAEILGSDAWTVETSGTSGIDKIKGISNGATLSTAAEKIDAGDLRFEVETSGEGEFTICGQKVTATGDDVYVVSGNSNGEIKVVPQGEEYSDDDSEAAGKVYTYDTAGDYTVNGITFHATENSKVQTITRGVEFDLSSGTFQYDGLTLSGGGTAQINRYNANLISLTNGAVVNKGDDESKSYNRQFAVEGTVEILGKKFETNQSVRCALVKINDLIGFVVEDECVLIQEDCYDSVKVVDKKISSIEGVKNSAKIFGNGTANISIVTTSGGEFTIRGINTYKISGDSDRVTFVTDSHGNVSQVNGLTGSIEGNFESEISVNGKAIRLTGANSIKVATDGENVTEITDVAGDLVTADGNTYRKDIRAYKLGNAKKLTTAADGTIIFNGQKFETSAGKTFTLDDSGNVSGLETAQGDTKVLAAYTTDFDTVEENFGTIDLSTTDGLEEIIGDFSEGLTVNGVFVRVTDSANFVVKSDAENIYIETTAADTFTINGKTFETYSDKTIFKLDASGNVSEIVTDEFFLDEEAYVITGNFNDEIIFNGKKFCVKGTNEASIFLDDETLIAVDLTRNAVEVVESGGAAEIYAVGEGDIIVDGKTFTTSNDFAGFLEKDLDGSVYLSDYFVGTINGELGGLELEGLTIASDDNFSVTSDGERITAIDNLQNGTLTGDDVNGITINGEKISGKTTLNVIDGASETSDPEIEDNEDAVTVKADRTLEGGEVITIEDTSARVNITASKTSDTIISSGKKVSMKFNGGATEIYPLDGRITLENYDAKTGAGFHADYSVAEFRNGKLTVDSAVMTFADGADSKLVNFYDEDDDRQKVGFASDDALLDASKEKGNLILYGGSNSTLIGGTGRNDIYLEEDSGATVALNGKNTIHNFNATFDYGDRISVDAANANFKFDGEDLTIKNGTARGLLESVSADDGTARILTVANGKEVKTAVAQNGAVITSGDELADVYIGKKSGVDFSGYEESLTIDLSDAQTFKGINQVTVGGGLNTVISSSRNETLSGNADGTTEFVFCAGGGRDFIQSFNFDEDKINVGTDAVTDVKINSAGAVRMQIGGGDDWITLDDAQGKTFKISDYVALVDKNITYNDAANYFVATARNATLTVTEEAEIWLDSSHGKIFAGDIRTLDASTAEGRTSLVGNDLDNTILAGEGDASLWGGNGGDDLLIGGDSHNTFFYTNGGGNDTISGANDGDLVYLSGVTLEQINGTNITADGVAISFADGGALQINSSAAVTYQLADGAKFFADRTKLEWNSK